MKKTKPTLQKLLFMLLGIFLLITYVNAQSTTAFRNVGSVKSQYPIGGKALQGISPNNVWVGAQIGYKFGGTEEFTDNLLVSGRLLYDISLGTSRFHLPVMGNISTLRDAFSNENNKDTIEARAQELLQSTQGINVGLYPFYELISKNNFLLTLYGAASWKLNSFKKEKENNYLNQARFSAGVEVSVGGRSQGRYPLVISITPTLTTFNPDKYEKIFEERRSSLTSLEISGVVPIGDGIGILMEQILAKKQYSSFKVGIIIAGQGSKSK